MSPASWGAVAGAIVALGPAGLRWLRVAQREHYLGGATIRFAWRWWGSEAANGALLAVGLAGIALGALWPLAALATAAVVIVGPLHLSLRGRSAPLRFTRRLRSLGAVWLVLQAAVVVVAVVVGGRTAAPLAAAGALAAPLLVDAACWAMAPVERRLAAPFVARASTRLGRVRPTVVAVTGSYGKTSTKSHIAHLVAGSRTVVATPASFNNRAGLARAVNEHLVEGTEVFVAEMGTYGPGEIAELCSWCPPAIAAITAIGPVHLERFGSEEAIATAKAEITERASVVVLNVDDPRLATLADRLAPAKTVVRCSTGDPKADVVVQRGDDGMVAVWVGGQQVADGLALGSGIQAANLAVAVGVALHLGVAPTAMAGRLGDLPSVPNRLTSARAPSGVLVLDDTYNANPAGTLVALAALADAPATRRRVVVTPGMVELGRRQGAENEAFGRRAAEVATDVVVVGRTNRRALLKGAAARRPVTVRTREQAVTWVRTHLGVDDAVLYENDLPDNYP